jgi:GNAT superfamily N-acetyltransferase
LGKVEQITKIHYNGLVEEFKAVGIEADIDYKHLKKKWKEQQDKVKTYTEDGKILGFITTEKEPMVYVDPEYQRQGIGSTLLKASNVRSVWVMNGNVKAEKFYYKNGFFPTVTRTTEKLGHKIDETRWVDETY